MHIDYRAILPESPVCEHRNVKWEAAGTDIESGVPGHPTEVPEGTPGAETVTVTSRCDDCPATNTKTFYYVRVMPNA